MAVSDGLEGYAVEGCKWKTEMRPCAVYPIERKVYRTDHVSMNHSSFFGLKCGL